MSDHIYCKCNGWKCPHCMPEYSCMNCGFCPAEDKDISTCAERSARVEAIREQQRLKRLAAQGLGPDDLLF